MTERSKLIFFTSADCRVNARPVRNALHFALAGAEAGLRTEVRLAGDAVRIVQDDGLPDTQDGREARQKLAEYSAMKGFTSL